MRIYLLIMVLAAAVTYLMVPVVRRVALAIGAVTSVRARDIHTVPIPRLGGIAMYCGYLVTLLMIITQANGKNSAFSLTESIRVSSQAKSRWTKSFHL